MDNTSGLLKPIIYCCPNEDIAGMTVSVNLLLAEKLVNCKPSRRTMKIEFLFNQVLEQLPDGVIIKDFDVMFNPEYTIDVLRVMSNACKKKQFSILWPGKYEDGKLFYSEEGYTDYRMFRVEEYDITCVV